MVMTELLKKNAVLKMSAVFNEARKYDFDAFYNISTAILP